MQVKYLSVSELNRNLNQTLESTFPEIYFQGEVSQITRAGSGHVYFTIKDERSQIRAVMWKGIASALKFEVKAGDAVVCHAKPNIYGASGSLQMVVHFMALAGEGLLQKKFLELKAKLEQEGLFDPERKRKLPYFPKSIGVVTSQTGAVIHDIMVKITERMPQLNVYLVPVRVQGAGASEEIAEAIEYFNELKNVEVIIIARGGGSLEDLWAFNEEKTVRAIFKSKIPTISGVGHEVDITLSDLVADVRAPTPTAAAEMVVPKKSDLLEILNGYERRLSDFNRWLMPLQQQVDEYSMRLKNSSIAAINHSKLKLEALFSRVNALEPSRLLKLFSGRLDNYEARFSGILAQKLTVYSNQLNILKIGLENVIGANIQSKAQTFRSLTQKLEAINPRAVLGRGYSLVQKNGKIVLDSRDLSPGDSLELTFKVGKTLAQVTKNTC